MQKTTRQCRVVMEEGGGFEPPESYPSMVFETIPFGRSGTLPRLNDIGANGYAHLRNYAN